MPEVINSPKGSIVVEVHESPGLSILEDAGDGTQRHLTLPRPNNRLRNKGSPSPSSGSPAGFQLEEILPPVIEPVKEEEPEREKCLENPCCCFVPYCGSNTLRKGCYAIVFYHVLNALRLGILTYWLRKESLPKEPKNLKDDLTALSNNVYADTTLSFVINLIKIFLLHLAVALILAAGLHLPNKKLLLAYCIIRTVAGIVNPVTIIYNTWVITQVDIKLHEESSRSYYILIHWVQNVASFAFQYYGLVCVYAYYRKMRNLPKSFSTLIEPAI